MEKKKGCGGHANARHLCRMNCAYSDYVFCYPLFGDWQKSVINFSFVQMVKTYN